jgi:hypothetical protein
MYGYGYSPFVKSATAATVTGPVNTIAPVISGPVKVGGNLNCSKGTWTGTPTITYTYQWKRNGAPIIGASNFSYLLVDADINQSIKCTVTATNIEGNTSADSNTVILTL